MLLYCIKELFSLNLSNIIRVNLEHLRSTAKMYMSASATIYIYFHSFGTISSCNLKAKEEHMRIFYGSFCYTFLILEISFTTLKQQLKMQPFANKLLGLNSADLNSSLQTVYSECTE